MRVSTNRFLSWALLASLLQMALMPAAFAQSMPSAFSQSLPPAAAPVEASIGSTAVTSPFVSPADEAIDTPGAILDYPLGINDTLSINIWSNTLRFGQTVVVPLEGRIYLPQIGEIEVVGLTTTQLKEKISRTIAGRVKDAKVSVLLVKTHTIKVYVTGLVKNPGTYSMNALGRFATALSLAGGPLPEGSLRQITLKQGSKTRSLDWMKLVREGDASQNPRLQAGDVIHVPQAQHIAKVEGAVNKPGAYEFLPGETIGTLIGFANGLDTGAAPGQASIAQFPSDAQTPQEERPIDLSSAKGLQTKLSHRDIITLPTNTLSYVEIRRTRVKITGEVANPAEYTLTLGNTLRDLLMAAGGPKPTAGLREVKIYRRGESGDLLRNSEAQVVDAYRLLYDSDDSQNVQLKDGDLVAVPVNKDPTEDSAVYVYGHVGKPGKMAYRSGYHLSDYLNSAGGPMPKANLRGVTITRMASDSKKSQTLKVDAFRIMHEGRQDLDPVLQEGDVIHVPESFFYIANFQDVVNVILAAAAVWAIFK
ncbi:Polysialic acid transport protein KpsD precursor [compost metagenome]